MKSTFKSALIEKEPVAIVGLGSLFPDAKSTEEFWNNIIHKVYSIREVPNDRWNPDMYYSDDRNAPDKTYSKIGGFITEFEFNPIHYRIPPKIIPQIDLVQQFALFAAKEALEDANYKSDNFPRESCAVIIGNSMGGDRKTEMDLRALFPMVIESLKSSDSFKKLNTNEQNKILEQLENDYKGKMSDITEDSMPGELSNVISGRIAATFNLRGKSMTSDAACASSLAAIDDAYKGLIFHEFDACVVGGADRSLMPNSYVKFSKIGALSADGSYPFDKRANGFVQGEGAGMMVLKRLSDAKKSGDKIYALIIGVGASSDGKGKGITAPNPIGQELAIRRAFADASITPVDIQLVEAHGTSTKVGDKVEVSTLNKFFGEFELPKHSIKLGSIKSQIGHLKSAAGAAGMIKTILALYHKILPPSINFENRNPSIDWDAGPLEVISDPIEWNTNGMERRATVSSFGFGGTNYVVVLEEYNPNKIYNKPSSKLLSTHLSYNEYVQRNKPLLNEAVLLGASSKGQFEKLLPQIQKLQKHHLISKQYPHLIDMLADLPKDGRIRMGISYKTLDELEKNLKLGIEALSDKSKRGIAQARGVFISQGLKKDKIGFLFPGQGSQYADMLLDLSKKYAVVKETFDEADAVLKDFLGGKLSSFIFTDGRDKKEVEEGLRQTQITQPAMLTADIALFRLLMQYNLKPDLVAGHSLGEYAALVAAEVLSFPDALMAVAIRGKAMSQVDADDKGTMAAISGKYEDIAKVLSEVKGYCIAANKNSHSSTVISGSTKGVEEAIKKFEEKGMKAIRLSVSAAFHTKIVEPAGDELSKYLDSITFNNAKLPITSNVTGSFFPENPEKIRDLMKRQVGAAVEWTEQIESMSEVGTNVFFEVGPKKALSTFVADILENEVLSVNCNHPKKGGLKTFNEALAAAYALGIDIPVFPAQSSVYHSEFQWGHLEVGIEETPVMQVNADMNHSEYQSLIGKTRNYLGNETGLVNKMGLNLDKIVVTGVGVGLPGMHKEVFDENNIDRLLAGENFIDLLPKSKMDVQLNKNIRRLIKKPSGDAEFFTPKTYKDVISLAGQAGKFNLIEEFDINPRIAGTYDDATSLAIAAGLLALRDAGIPLVRAYKKTSTGSFLPGDWELPVELQDDTGIIFASAFPGYNQMAKEITTFNRKKFDEKAKRLLNDMYAEISRKVTSEHEKKYLLNKLENELKLVDPEDEDYQFNRKILLEVLSMGHAQFAQLIKARGPNTQVNAACASTTQAIGIANDWIRAGRCKRVIVISADNVTSDNLFEWLGSGFLATGAAAIKDKVEEAALPFDRRRDGMIIGMGAAALVVETAEESQRRGVTPIVELLGTYYSNSSFHGTRLDVNHVSSELTKFMDRMNKMHNIVPEQIATSMMFMSHETYTPRRGGSAAAEIRSLQDNFGRNSDKIHIANTKGFTGHAMGAGIEDVVAIKSIERGIIPPIANFKQPDPDLGNLRISRGEKVQVDYALRLAAGFGSQIAFALYKRTSSGDRFGSSYDQWLYSIGGTRKDLYLENKSFRLRDKGATHSKSIVPANVKRVNAFQSTHSVTKVPQKQVKPVVKAKPLGNNNISSDELQEVLIDEIAKSTGYPREMVDPALELEADLGIDSVKTAEIFGIVREKYNLEEDGELNLAEYPTIEKMAEYFSRRMGGSNPSQSVQSQTIQPQSTPIIKETSSSISSDELQEVLIDEIAKSTGYPREMVDPALELEADLGIDSVKTAEIFGIVREKYNLEEDGELNLAEYPTIEKMAEYFSSRMDNSQRISHIQEAPSQKKEEAISITEKPPIHKPQRKNMVAPEREELQEILIDEIAKATGYPREMVDPALELESDLGIDSVKTAEIFGIVREKYNLEEDGELNLAEYPTIEKMAEYFTNQMSNVKVSSTSNVEGPTEISEIDQDNLQQTLIEEIARSTGYPTSMISADLDLEADLGVDSVKVAEVFSVVRDRYGVQEDPELQISDYPTIEKIAKYLSIHSGKNTEKEIIPKIETPISNNYAKIQKIPRKPSGRLSSKNISDSLMEFIADITETPISMIGEYVSIVDDLGFDEASVISAVEQEFSISGITGSTIGEIIKSVQKLGMKEPPASKATLGEKSRTLTSKQKVYEIISSISGIPISMIDEYVSLTRDLSLSVEELENVRKTIQAEFEINLVKMDIIKDILDSIPKDIAGVSVFIPPKPVKEGVIKPKSVKISSKKQDFQTVQKRMIEIVAEETGYDSSMLDAGMSLEEDLGIDSIKIAGIMGTAREEFGVPKNDDIDLSQYDSIEKMAKYMFENAGTEESKKEEAVKTEKTVKLNTHRYVIRENNVNCIPDPFKGSGYIFGRKNSELSGLAKETGLKLAASLKKDTDIQNNSTLIFVNSSDKSLGSIPSIFSILKESIDSISKLVLVVRDKSASFGSLSAYQGALGGMFKALAQEFDHITAKILVVEEYTQIRGEISQDAVEVVYKNGNRWEIALNEQDLRQTDFKLPKHATILVSGGAQGITYETIKSIISEGNVIFLLGRTIARDDAAEIAELNEEQLERRKLELLDELKKDGKKITPVMLLKEFSKLTKSASVWENIEELKEIGADVIYVPMDVSNKNSVDSGFETINKILVTLSRGIDYFIHGAGVEISRPTKQKSLEEFQLVYDIKTKGLEYILEHLELENLKRMITFSSVAGRFGNATQADYSAANEYLAKRSIELREKGVNATTIDWSAWADVGMATRGSTMKILESAGVTAIPLEEGIARFRSEFFLSDESEVVISGELGGLAQSATWFRPDFEKGIMIDELGESRSIRTLSLTKDKYLDDHRIDGKAVLPGVMGMETMAQTVRAISGKEVILLHDVKFNSPVKLPRDNDLEIHTLFRNFGGNFDLTLKSKFLGPDGKQLGDLRDHFTASVVNGNRFKGYTVKIHKGDEILSKSDIYKVFFHGPSYQVLKSLNYISSTSGVAIFNKPTKNMFNTDVNFEIDPLSIEAAFQAAGLHLMLTKKVMGLPSAIGSLQLYKQEKPVKYLTVYYRKSTDTHSLYDVLLADEDGVCVASLHNYEMVHTGSIDVPDVKIKKDNSIEQVRHLAGELDTDIFSVDIKPLESVSEEFIENYLLHSEQTRYNTIKIAKKRTEWLSGRIAAKNVLSKLLQVSQDQIEILKDENKAPYTVVNGKIFNVSISHSNGIAMAITGDKAVDVEKVEKKEKSFVKSMFSEDEMDSLSLDNDVDITKYWSMKESHLKRMRIGLKTEIKSVEVTDISENTASVESDHGSSITRSKTSDNWVVTIASN